MTNPFLLILEGVLDPRNLGACLRSAEAAGVHGVVLPRSRMAPLNAAARKTAAGATRARPPFMRWPIWPAPCVPCKRTSP